MVAEKTAPCFVVATANDISKLPPELLRKGRFDEVFFFDLPNQAERREIFTVHQKKRGRNSRGFNLDLIAQAANGYVGAEIEHAVTDALYLAYNESKRDLKTDDIVNALKAQVPLSVSQREVIECLRQWPRDGRARTASVTDATKDSNQSRLRTQHRLTSARRTSSPSDHVIQRRDYHDKQPRQLRLYRHQQRGRLELLSSARTADHQPSRHAAQFPAVRTAITHAPRFAQVLEFADRRHELPQVFQRRLHSEARC